MWSSSLIFLELKFKKRDEIVVSTFDEATRFSIKNRENVSNYKKSRVNILLVLGYLIKVKNLEKKKQSFAFKTLLETF